MDIPLPESRTPVPELVTRFREDGYVVLKHFLPNVTEYHDAIESTVRENLESPIFARFQKNLSLKDIGYTFEDFMNKSSALRIPEIHAISEPLRRLVDACRFEQYLAPFVTEADRVDLLQSLYFPFSSNQASHSDKFLVSPPHAPYHRESLIGVWLALDGTSMENGALFGWSGSQRVPGKPMLSDYEQYGDYSRELSVTMLNAGLRPHFIYAEAGDVVLWASDFVHGGARPLMTDRTRRALVLHYGALLAS